MKYFASPLPAISQRFVKVIFYAVCIPGLFSNVSPYSGTGKINEYPGNNDIICTVGDRLITIKNANTTLRINNDIRFEMYFSKDGKNQLLTKPNNKASAVYLTGADDKKISFTRKSARIEDINNEFGKGRIVKVEALSPDGGIICNISFGAYYRFPHTILVKSSFKNISSKAYQIRDYTIDNFSLQPPAKEKKWWSFQGASYYWGQDFAFNLPDSFSRDNYMGLNDTKIGGGIPFVDVWNKEFGLAIASIDDKPRDIYLPVNSLNGEVDLQIKENHKSQELEAGDSLVTVQTAIMVHKNDYYDPLKTYSALMKPYLADFKKPTEFSYKPEWCTWGFRQNFKPKDVLDKLARLKVLGMKSVILDDGWSDNHGDWIPDPAKFPNGEQDFKQLISQIHAQDMKVWIWWVPGYADSMTRLAKEKPEWFVKNKDGSIHSSYALCPAYAPVQEHFKKLVEKFITEYKLDGFKLDFQEINSAPPCYNSVHNHKDPFDSYRSTPALFKNIYQTAIQLKPDMLIEYCSCGIPPSIHHLPWFNMAVTSDPGVSQITQRIKMYKALMGDDFPVLEEYCGVLAGPLYQLVIGTGGVPGSFSTDLDEYHDKWLNIYLKKQLSNGGQYLNLYDIGFDFPEAHVIKKNNSFFYAFYTNPWKHPAPKIRVYRYGTEFDYEKNRKKEYNYPAENFTGKLELRGLDKNKKYRIVDYGNNKELGIISGDKPYFNTSFDDYLLLELIPI